MSKEEFTKGNWRSMSEDGCFLTSDVWRADNYQSDGYGHCEVQDSSGRTLALVVEDDHEGPSDQEQIANTHLIAAAPKMYLALKHLHDTMINSTPNIDLYDGVVLSADLIGKLLAEARGEKQ